MPIQVRLAAIVAAAVMAATVHHRYLKTQIEQRPFVAAAREFKVGEQPQMGDLLPISLGGDLASLTKVLVPWDERSMILGTPLLRDFKSGELLARRDVEPTADCPYQPRANEYVFVVAIPDSAGLKTAFQIGSPVGFLLEKHASREQPSTFEECGPFVVRQFGPLSRQVDQRIVQKMSATSVTLSLPAAPGGKRPARAQQLLNAVGGKDFCRIIGLYHPRVKG